MEREPTPEKETILTKLKKGTADQHQQTEDQVDVMSDDFSLTDYRDLLVRFYAFYKPFEAKMSDALARHRIEFDYAIRLNSPKIFSDLRRLGVSEEAISQIEPTGDLPSLDSPEKVFGALYVVEGSTLGGQIISRHLKEKFNFGETGGIDFFSGYGAETGKMWNAFRAAIGEFAENNPNHAEIVGAAVETFKKIGRALARK